MEHRFKAHQRSEHLGLKPYVCEETACERTFTSYLALTEHVKSHSQVGAYICQENGCGLSYQYEHSLKMHIRKVHLKDFVKKIIVCEICGKSVQGTKAMKNHSYLHMDKSLYPYVCEEPNCGRRFIQKPKLIEHTKRHKGIKEHVCPYCGLKQTSKSDLKKHMNFHTMEKEYPCKFCSHISYSSSNLKGHVRAVHEKALIYPCRHCDRYFATTETRKYHEMTHTGERPHECPECGKGFTQPSSMKSHRKTHYKNGEAPPLPRKKNIIIGTNRIIK